MSANSLRPVSGALRPEWEGARGGGGEAVRFNSILVCAEPVAWGRVDASNSRYVDSAPTAITDFGLAVTRSSVRALPVAVQQTRHRRPRRISSALSHSGSCTRSTKRHRSPQLPHTTDLPSGWRRPLTVCLNSLASDRCSVCWQALPPRRASHAEASAEFWVGRRRLHVRQHYRPRAGLAGAKGHAT